jgi:heat shock transcription factor, other eukaryote
MALTDYSFLDDGKNTNLIRWSDDGNSFVVEDEDEFAKKLIPELFKHNNYASFVRQLNMYGFHKKVGLSDNSMRASEKKSKSPSEYSNPYFRRGHPDLLWLIQKPRNVPPGHSGRIKTPATKRADLEPNEDEHDDYIEEIQPTQQQQQSQQPKTKPQGRLPIGQGYSNLPSEQLVNVHRELHAIRAQQAQIAAMIHRLKREHEQLYGQAANFQDQHSRHENSINAILTFLATVYNRSLQGHEGVQGIANLFTGSIPPDSNQSHVVDVGDYTFDQFNGADGSTQRSFKRQPLLLKAPPLEEGRASTATPLTGGSLPEGRQTRRMSPAVRNCGNQLGDVEELLDMRNDQQAQPQPRPQPQNTQRANQSSHQNQSDILSVIQNTNARNSAPGTPASDFSNVLNSLETSGGGSPLTNSQRADMLRLIHNQGSASNTGDNALTSPNPPPMPKNFDHQLAATKSDLDFLAKMQADQDRSVQNLTNLLQPLSPTGSIPGLGDGGGDVQPPPLDIEDFLNSTANYLSDFPPDHNFDFNSTDLNNQTASTNGINFANLADGDDELFGNIGSNNHHNNNNNHNHTTTNNNVSNQDLPTTTNTTNYDYLNIDGATSDNGGGGKVESMASSEEASPTNTIDTIDGDGGVGGPPVITRSRAFDQQQPQYQSVENQARKRKRVS